MEGVNESNKLLGNNYTGEYDPLDPIVSIWPEIVESVSPRIVGELDMESGKIENVEVIEDLGNDNIVISEGNIVEFSIKVKSPQVPEDVLLQLLDVVLDNPIRQFKDHRKMLQLLISEEDTLSTIFDIYYTLKGRYVLYSGRTSDIGNLILMLSNIPGRSYASGISFDGSSYFRVLIDSGSIRAYRAKGEKSIFSVKVWRL